MSGHARKLRRASKRNFEREYQAAVETSQDVLKLAGESLGFDEQQTAAAEHSEAEDGAVFMARVLEILELTCGLNEQSQAQRAELERRYGPGFLAKVSAMGRPAAEVLGSHKIHAGNYRLHSPEWYRRYHAHLGRRQVWIRSRGNFGNSVRRFSSRRFSPTGCGRGGSSSYARARSSRSSCVGGVVAFELEQISQATSRISRSNGATARSSVRLGAPSVEPVRR